MNKMQALIKCRNLWSYMAITGSRQKTDYKPARRWAFQCPCCMKAGATLTYLGENADNRDCTKCILNGYAWGHAVNYSQIICYRDNSSYFKQWDECTLSRIDRIHWAKRMVQACNRAIEDLIVLGRLHP